MLGDTGSRADRPLVHDLVEHSEAAGDIVQGEEVGGAMLALRSFMFEHVYLGPTGAGRAREDRARPARAVRLVLRAPGGAAAGRRRRVDADRVIDYLAGMTDRFAIRAWTERVVPAGPAGLMARYTDDSASASATRSTSWSSSARGPSCASAGAAATRAVPVPRRADAVVRDRPGREALPLLRLRRGRRRLQVRDGDRGARLRVALESLAERYGVELEREAEDPRGGRAPRARATGCSRCSSAPPRTTCGCCGSRDEAADARAYLLGRGLSEGDAARVPRRLLADGVGPGAERPRGGRATRTRSCSPPGWPCAAARAGSTTASAAGSCSRLPTSAGACSGSARGRCATTRGRSTSTRPRARSSTRGAICLRRRPRAAPAAAQAGSVVLVEGYTDVIALHQAGVGKAVGSMGTALTDEQVDALSAAGARRAVLPGRRRGGPGGCAVPGPRSATAGPRPGVPDRAAAGRRRPGRRRAARRAAPTRCARCSRARCRFARFEVEPDARRAARDRRGAASRGRAAPAISRLPAGHPPRGAGPARLRPPRLSPDLVERGGPHRPGPRRWCPSGRRSRAASPPAPEQRRAPGARPPRADRARVPRATASPCRRRARRSSRPPTSTRSSPRRSPAAPPSTCGATSRTRASSGTATPPARPPGRRARHPRRPARGDAGEARARGPPARPAPPRPPHHRGPNGRSERVHEPRRRAPAGPRRDPPPPEQSRSVRHTN